MDAIIYNTDVKDMIVSTVNEYGWESAKNQALSFWTTYCCACDKYPDTATYDSIILEIWTELSKLEEFKHWDAIQTFDNFDEFMCQNLV